MNIAKSIFTTLTFALVLAASTVMAHPGDLPDDLLSYVKRDGLMHLIKGQQYILQEMLIGKREVNQQEFVRAARSLAALFSMVPSTFEKNLTVDVSRAKPEIWQNWVDFTARAAEFQKIAEEIAAMGEIRGAEATMEKVRLFDCNSCHDIYRK